VGFARSRLSVGEHSAVIAIQDLFDQRRHHDGVDIALLGLGAEAAVKGELLGELGVQGVTGDYFPGGHHIHDLGGSDAAFPGIEGPAKNEKSHLDLEFHWIPEEYINSPDAHIHLDVLVRLLLRLARRIPTRYVHFDHLNQLIKLLARTAQKVTPGLCTSMRARVCAIPGNPCFPLFTEPNADNL